MKVKVKDIVQMAQALLAITEHEGTAYGEDKAIELAQKIIDDTNNDYERGWHDAIKCALDDTHRDIDGFLAKQGHISKDALKRLDLAHNETAVNLEREVEI